MMLERKTVKDREWAVIWWKPLYSPVTSPSGHKQWPRLRGGSMMRPPTYSPTHTYTHLLTPQITSLQVLQDWPQYTCKIWRSWDHCMAKQVLLSSILCCCTLWEILLNVENYRWKDVWKWNGCEKNWLEKGGIMSCVGVGVWWVYRSLRHFNRLVAQWERRTVWGES